MAANDEMSIDERRKYLYQMQKRYRKASRQEKTKLLDEMQAVTGQHRKHLTRLMNGSLERQPRRRERGRTYGHDVAAAVVVIVESLDWVCAERLQPNLGWMADHLVAHGELSLAPGVREKLDRASISTVQRLLADQPRERPRLPRRGPTQAHHLRREIPMRRIPWDEVEPGHFEVDLVHHCGPATSGHYVHTCQMIDVATGWSERAATLGRSFLVMSDAFHRILARLPFPIHEIHPDNGSEFLNDHLVRFWRDKVTGVQLSRSRPYHKNDNRFVEQKNYTLVRAYLGDDRFDTVAQTLLLNTLYDHMWRYYNFFQPAMRLTEKLALPADNGQHARFRRRFDDARTPFDRLCQTDGLTPAQQVQLHALRDQANPRQLRRDIYTLLNQLFALPNAAPDSTQDVYQTLFAPHLVMKGEARPVTLSFE
jgi:hypothetical protein